MKSLSLVHPVDPEQLEKDTLRVYEICDGCRRCFNLCPSFNTLLGGIDRCEGDVAKLTSADHRQVVDECYYCKLCFNHCPYTPPHQYGIDFPHLMVLWKKRLAVERGVRWRDRLLIKTDLIGKLGSLTAPLTNRLLDHRLVRRLLELVAGIHRDRKVLHFSGETFPRWFSRRVPAALSGPPVRKVALFSSCLVNYQATDIGKAAVQVLEKNRVQVVVPAQRCCGMPHFDIGDTAAIRQACPNTEVIALTSYRDSEWVQAALRAGAIAYLLKNVSSAELADAIRAAKAGRPTLSLEATQALIQAASRPPARDYGLSVREREVLALMVEGLNNAEIAERLVVSLSTVKYHISNILMKLGVDNRVAAVTMAIQRKLV